MLFPRPSVLFALPTLLALTACSLDEPVNPWTKSSSGGAASSSTTGSSSTSTSTSTSASSSSSSMGNALDCASHTLSPCILADGIVGLTGLATDGLTAYATRAGSNQPPALLELSAVARSTPVVMPTAAAPSSPLLSEGMVYWKARGTGAFDGAIWRIEPGNVPRMVTGMLNDGPFTVDGSQVVWAANYTAWELYGCPAASNCSPVSLGSPSLEPTQLQSIGNQLVWTSGGSLFHCTSGQCQEGAFSGLPSPTVSALVIANGAPVVALDEGLYRCELASGACTLLYPTALVLQRKLATNGSEIFFTDDQAISHVSSNGTDLGSVSFQWSKVVGLQVVGAFVYLADAGSGTVWRAAW